MLPIPYLEFFILTDKSIGIFYIFIMIGEIIV